MITVRRETIADETIDFLQSNENEEFFLYAQFWDPHLPYKRSDEEIERFLDETSLPPYPTEEQFERHSEWDA